MFHADPHRSISAHRMSGKPSRAAIRNRAIVSIDIGDQVLCDICLPIACRGRIRKHAAVIDRIGIWKYQDHFTRRCVRDRGVSGGGNR
jgi:hypothetical protein